MKCPKCGKENANDDIFCIYCGAKLNPGAGNPGTSDPGADRTEPAREKREVSDILTEFLPRLAAREEYKGKFVIAPNIDNENCRQVVGELLDVGFLGTKGLRECGETAIESILECGERIQGAYVSGFGKLNYMPTVLIFSDRALYAFWNNAAAWYLRDSGGKKKFVYGCKCRYDAIDKVSVLPSKVGEGVTGLGTGKVSCSLRNSEELFQFTFEKKYIHGEALAEMVRLLAAN